MAFEYRFSARKGVTQRSGAVGGILLFCLLGAATAAVIAFKAAHLDEGETPWRRSAGAATTSTTEATRAPARPEIAALFSPHATIGEGAGFIVPPGADEMVTPRFSGDQPEPKLFAEAQPVDSPALAPESAEPVAVASLPVAPAEIALAPLPPRRPEGLSAAPQPRPAVAARPVEPSRQMAEVAPRRREPGRMRRAVASRNAPAEPTFFERLFGRVEPASGAAMAYAPSTAVRDAESVGAVTRMASAPMPAIERPAPSLFSPRVSAGSGRAVYDISTRTVHLPDGTRLVAQSGLGAMKNDPRYAHVRMKGVTPPHVYNLVEREALFHGVRAIRLHPVGGSGAIYGRAGLLAHTYMLGPGGDSNGCVSIADYNAFLQAYLSGKIRQLIVVETMSDLPKMLALADRRYASK